MAKGRKLENKIASLFRSKFKTQAIRTPGSGSGKHKGDVYNRYFSVECKNHEKISLYKFWDQTISQKMFHKPPVLFVKSNHRPILAVMDVSDWLDLVKQAYFEGEEEKDR